MTIGLGIGLGITIGASGQGGGGLPVDVLYKLHAKDGSQGDTYTAPAGMTGIQWFRRALAAPFAQTAIDGATASAYTTAAADGPDVSTPTRERFRMVAQGMLAGRLVNAVSLQPVLPAPVPLATYDDLTNTTTANGTQSINTSRKAQGTGSIELVQTGTSSPQATKTGVFNGDPNTLGAIVICADLGDDPEFVNASQIGVNLRKGSTDYTQASVTTRSTTNATLGQRWQGYHVSEVPALAAAGAGTYDIKTQLSSAAPYANVVRYDAAMGRGGGRAKIIFTADDGRPGYKNVAVPILEAAGFRATFFIPTALLNQANRFTDAEVQELDQRGHDIALDLTEDDSIATTQPSLSGLLTQYQTQRNRMLALGVSARALDLSCYPNGSTRTVGTIIQKAGVVCAGGNFITPPDITSLVVGMKVGGYRVPRTPATRITNIDTGTGVVTVSGAGIPAQTVALSFTDDSGEFYTGKLQAGLASIGVDAVRQTNNGTGHTRFYGGGAGAMLLPGIATAISGGLTAAKPFMDQAVLRGETLIFYSHDVYPGATPIDTDEQVFRDIVGYSEELSDAGLADVTTFSQARMADRYNTVPF